MTCFVQCVKMPIFILSQGIFKWLASIYQPWQSSVDLSGVGQELHDKTVTGCMHPLSSYHIAQYKSQKERQETHEE